MAQATPETPAPSASSTIDTYRRWQEAQKIPRVTGFYVEDIQAIETAPWEWKGGRGAFINLEGTGGINDAYVCDIPPGGKLKPQRHLYEEMAYILKGQGTTTVWQDAGKKHTVAWKAGSLLAIPLNARYQHCNGSSSEEVRYFAVTAAPLVMNLFHNLDFIFHNDFTFTDRFDPTDAEFFTREGTPWGLRSMILNFIPDVHSIPLKSWTRRGAEGRNLHFDMASQTMLAHISEFPVGTYKKGHRHGPGAHVIILTGHGYSLLWPEGGKQVRVDWKPGSLVVPPNQWFHQHFNAGAAPVRYLALRKGGRGRFKFPVTFHDEEDADEAAKQIEYEEEDPQIHQDFEAALKKAGARCAMGAYHPLCTQT